MAAGVLPAYGMKINITILLSEGEQILQAHVRGLFHSFKIFFTAQGMQKRQKDTLISLQHICGEIISNV